MNRTERMCQPSAQAVMGQAVGAISKLKAQIATLEREKAEAQGNYEGACKTIAQMHAAAVGEVTGPKRGVIEDIEDLRKEVEQFCERSGRAFCSYCTFSTSATDDGALDEIQKHVLECEQHPLGKLVRELRAEVEQLRGKRDSLAGWFVAAEREDGSLILENSSGDRRHVWSCDIAERERDEALTLIE